MKKMTIVAAALLLAASASLAFSEGGPRRFRELLTGVQEVPVVSTTGRGTLQLDINRAGTEIAYELTFTGLEGDVRQSHIHIGPPQNTGGIVLWLCQTETNPSPVPTTPPCISDPLNPRDGRVTGVLTAADVREQPANGIAAGELGEVIALIRAGKTYANVHSAKFPPGEVRGQIERGGGHGRH